MSDIAPEEVPDEAPAEFDFDAELADLEATAPPEFQERIRKLGKENQSIRGRLKESDSRWDGFTPEDKQAINDWLDDFKRGDLQTAAKRSAAFSRALAGDKFSEIIEELSPKEQAEVKEEIADAVADTEDKRSVEEIVKAAIADHEAEKSAAETQKQAVAKIESELREVGLEPQTFEAKMVLQLAYDETKGDITKAKERFDEILTERAKSYIQSKGGDALIDTDTEAEPLHEEEKLTPVQKMERRFADMDRAAN